MIAVACNTQQSALTNLVDDEQLGKSYAENPIGITNHTVAVIDDGFDLSHPVFKDKIVGKYTINCNKQRNAENLPSNFDDMKKVMIEKIKTPTSRCTVEDSINFEAGKDIEQFVGYKDVWNDGILSKNGVNLEKDLIKDISEALSGKNSDQNYHGTNTAGVISYKNKNTKFVFIQMEILKPGEKSSSQISCPTQDEIDRITRIYEDKQYIDAYATAPLSELTRRLREIETHHKITLVNLSFGAHSRETAENIYFESCGVKLDLSRSYAAIGALEQKRAEWLAISYPSPIRDYQVTVQAAGNSDVRIDDHSDTRDCGRKEDGHILAGSYSFEKERSTFSNHGDCVDYYVLGEAVVVAAPSDFIFVADGTSFSAPLLTRYLSLQTKAGIKYTDSIFFLDLNSDRQGFMSTESYPKEISFQNKDEQIVTYALSSTNGGGSSLVGAIKPNILNSLLLSR